VVGAHALRPADSHPGARIAGAPALTLTKGIRMATLSAKFTVNISAPCLIEWPEQPLPEITALTGGFQVSVCVASVTGKAVRLATDRDMIRGIEAIEVVVSRDEPTPPPEGLRRSDGTLDLTDQHGYVRDRLPAYREAALSVTNRVLHFFQYRLHTPLVRPIAWWEHALNNPTWYKNASAKLPAQTATMVLTPLLGSDGELGARTLTPNDIGSLQAYLAEPETPSLPEQLLSDAQSAWFEENLRRSVLELAISAEILVKRKFFAKSSPAGAAFDYLEDKAKISVRVLDLLDGVAKEAFSHSYKEDCPDQYRQIDYLFRCRNKVVHRGELSFRDDNATFIHVDKRNVALWWQAITHLMTWLDALQ
jgi:hypothetical protein